MKKVFYKRLPEVKNKTNLTLQISYGRQIWGEINATPNDFEMLDTMVRLIKKLIIKDCGLPVDFSNEIFDEPIGDMTDLIDALPRHKKDKPQSGKPNASQKKRRDER